MTGQQLSARAAVIYDLDGTLIDSGADIAAAANYARQALGMTPLPAAVAIGYVGDGVQRLLERVLAHDDRRATVSPSPAAYSAPVAAEAVAAGLAHFSAFYTEHLLDTTRLYPGIAELLARLAGRPLFLATNKPRRFTLAILAGLGIERCFRRIVAGDDVAARKPDPAHLAACLAGTRMGPADVIAVGDSPNDVLAARGFGCRVVAVGWGLTAAATLAAARPDAFVATAAELARELAVGD